MTDEAGFLAHIAANPPDRVARLAYADWLEEQGDDYSLQKANYLRVEDELQQLPADDPGRGVLVQRLRKIAIEIPGQWKACVARIPLEKCKVQFEFLCPQKWENLQSTEEGDVRFCTACEMNVYYCYGIEEARIHTNQGHCIALDVRVNRRPNDLEPIVSEAELESVEEFIGMMNFEKEIAPPDSLWRRFLNRIGLG